MRLVPPYSDSALPRFLAGTASAMYACLLIIQNAKLPPAANLATNSIPRLGLLAAASAATANSEMPTTIVRHIPKRDTKMPAGTSNASVPICRAPTVSPTIASVARSSSRAKMGSTGIRSPCPNANRNDGAYTVQIKLRIENLSRRVEDGDALSARFNLRPDRLPVSQSWLSVRRIRR